MGIPPRRACEVAGIRVGCDRGGCHCSGGLDLAQDGFWSRPGVEVREIGKDPSRVCVCVCVCVCLFLPSHSPTWLKSILGVWPGEPEAKSLLVFKSRRRYLISSLDIRGGRQGTSAPGSSGKLENDRGAVSSQGRPQEFNSYHVLWGLVAPLGVNGAVPQGLPLKGSCCRGLAWV